MKNETTQEKLTSWDKLTLWWFEMGGVSSHDEKLAKPDRRGEFIFTVTGAVVLPLIISTIAIIHFTS